MLRIKNAIVVCDELTEGKYIYINEGKIEAVTEKELPYEREIDAEGQYVSAGFIDIHTHGAGGFDFADGGTDDIFSAARLHACHGTTTIFPTCTSSSYEDTVRFIENVRLCMQKNAPGAAHIAGSHLEGPYFSEKMCGAQNTQYLKNPEPSEYKSFVERSGGTLRRISFAPELEGAKELCEYLAEHGVVAAYGHTNAIYDEIKPLIPLGCTLATHLYSGMGGVERRNLFRKLGAVESAFLEDDVYVEIIADGMHLPPELLRMIYKIKGADRICLITDSMRGAGMPDGESVLGPLHDGMACTIHDGVAYLNDMSGFAGSVATSDRLVRTMHKAADIPLLECVKMMTETPAAMGLCGRGKIEQGFFADLVFFDEDINVSRVIIEGEELRKCSAQRV